MAAPDTRDELRADCSRCVGLCCVVPAFARSADFAFDKPAGRPCPNLATDHRCGIHASLRERGMPGCVVFDCFGAGQLAVASGPDAGAVFTVLRQVQEARWYLADAAAHAGAAADEVAAAQERAAELSGAPPGVLTGLDVAAYRAEVGELLGRVSAAARSGLPGRVLRGADLVGRRMEGADLCGADLRGAYLIGADLRGADLRLADLLGADLRACDVRGADLSTALYLTQPQLEAATGDGATRIPPFLHRPAHWA